MLGIILTLLYYHSNPLNSPNEVSPLLTKKCVLNSQILLTLWGGRATIKPWWWACSSMVEQWPFKPLVGSSSLPTLMIVFNGPVVVTSPLSHTALLWGLLGTMSSLPTLMFSFKKQWMVPLRFATAPSFYFGCSALLQWFHEWRMGTAQVLGTR